jgi:hypothetical protein
MRRRTQQCAAVQRTFIAGLGDRKALARIRNLHVAHGDDIKPALSPERFVAGHLGIAKLATQV